MFIQFRLIWTTHLHYLCGIFKIYLKNSVVRIVIGEYVDALGNLVDSREFTIDSADFPDGNFEFRLPDELLRELTYGWQIFVDDAEGNPLFESELYTFNVMEEDYYLASSRCEC